MRFTCAAVSSIASLLLSGCGYVHFGRLPATAPRNDAALAAAYSDLTTEHKILKQELALVRKETDALRFALERAGGGAGAGDSGDLRARLNEATQELATLRANYTKLKDERAGSLAAPALEENRAASLRNYTALQEENGRLHADLERARTENATLAGQLKLATAQHERSRDELAQLSTELLAQKEARARAEQATSAVRVQLDAVLARDTTLGPTAARENPLSSALQLAKAPPAGSLPVAVFRRDADTAGHSEAAGRANRVAELPQTHVVQPGDTFESIARRYYDAPERWREIYDANAALFRDGESLRAGMELQLPAN